MRYSFLFFSLILFSCGTDAVSENNHSNTAAVAKQSSSKCDPSAEPNFKGLISSNMEIGGFRGGEMLELEPLKIKGFQFSGVEGEENIIQHVFTPDMREFMIVRESKKDHIIREITLITRDYITDKCIGVQSSLEEFAAAYPDFEIGYDSGNDSFYISSAELLGVKFNLLTTTYTGDMNSVSPRNKFKKDDFSADTKIMNVNLSDF